jgi:uncharacterized membrane protein
MEQKQNDALLNDLLARLDELSRSVASQQGQIDRLRQQIRQLQAVGTTSEVQPPVTQVAESLSTPVNLQPGSFSAPPPTAAPFPKPAAPPRQSLEQYIGGNLINKIGILILVLGVGIFLNYAFENNLLGPVARIGLGYVAGIALTGLAWWLKKEFPAYGAVLLSGGVSTLYFTTYFAYDFYALLPHLAAFGIMLAVTAFTIYAATKFNQQVIGVYGLVGAYAVPLLLSQKSGNVAVLFAYIGIINAGVGVLAYRKRWPAINVAAFVVTWLTFGLWYIFSYQPAVHLPVALGFGTIFFLLFYAIFGFEHWPEKNSSSGKGSLLVSNAFIFYLLGYAALQSSAQGAWQGLFTLAVAAVHGGVAAFVWSRKGRTGLFYLALLLAIAFLTIAVPVQFEGNPVTWLWAAQAAVLFLAGQQMGRSTYSYPALAVLTLSVVSLLTGWAVYRDYPTAFPFLLNRHWAASVWAVLTQVLIVWQARRTASRHAAGKDPLAPVWQHVLPVVSAAILYGAFARELDHHFGHRISRLAPGFDSLPSDSPLRGTAESLRMLRQQWLLNFTGFYVAALGGVTLLLRGNRYQTGALVIAGSVVLLWWLTAGLTDADLLWNALRQGQPESTFAYAYIRYLVYLGVGASVAAGALLVRQLRTLRPGSLWKWYPAVIHLFVIALLSAELVQIFLKLAPGVLTDRKELAQKLGFSVLWGVYALGLIMWGIWRKRRVMRVLGITLFAVTLGKLFLFDLGDIPTLGKIIAFVGLGVLLLVISFLYQKFKDVILAEDKEDGF